MNRRLALVLACILPAAVIAAGDTPPKPHVLLKFDGNSKNQGTGQAKVSLKNTTFKNKALVVNGIYPDGPNGENGSDVQIATPKLSHDTFTVAIRFKADAFPERRSPVIVGGMDYRWFVISRNGNGKAEVGLNNLDNTFEAKNAPLEANKWTVVACSVSVPKKKAILFVNGKKADEFTLPNNFAFSVGTSDRKDADKIWTTANYSNSTAFKGQIDELIIYSTALTAEQLAKVPLKP